MIKKLLLTTTAVAVFSVSGPAFAGGEMSDLQDQINALQKQLNVLQSKLEKQESKGGSISGAKISFHPSPKIESSDGTFSFQPFGRAHLDYAAFSDDKKDHADNSNFRRARVGFKGKVAEDFKYKAEFDLAKEEVNFKDVSLTYTGLDAGDIQVGHFKPVFGLEENTSSNYIQFLERSAPNSAFSRDEEIGLAFKTGGDDWSFGVGAYGGDAGDTSTADDEFYSLDARASFAPVNEKGKVVHVGLGGSYRGNSDTAKFKAKSTGIGTDLVSTGTISGVDNVTVIGAELAAVLDSLSFQSEYFSADVNRASATDASFDGWVAQASYLLTGESRPYKGEIGNFSRVKPNSPFSLKNGGTGAWEILARFENLDLNDNSSGILGGELENTTIGVNWYLNNNFRLMFNYIDVDTDANSVVASDSPQIYTARASWDF